MEDLIYHYHEKGWKVTYNKHDQVVFTNPKTNRFFNLNGASKRDKDLIDKLD